MSALVRVAMWSGPRNISTAMMRSWENRPDTVVVDEPLYAAHLARTGLDHPGRAEVLAAQPTDQEAAIAALDAPLPSGVGVQYVKHMSHHLDPARPLEWTEALANALLIREPGEVVASYVKSREVCEPEDIGLLQQLRLLQTWDAAGLEVPIIDAADFLRAPQPYLRWLCDWLGIAFTDRMLGWPAGRRESDGVWAPHWYDAVWASTGFAAYRPREVDLNAHDAAVAETCRPAYAALHERRLRL